MRILYLRSSLSINSNSLKGRSLVRQLASEHEVLVRHAVVADDVYPRADARIVDDLLPEGSLPEFDAIYMEGGWASNAAPRGRLAVDVASEFVRGGGQLIVADVDRNRAIDHSESLRRAGGILGSGPWDRKYVEDVALGSPGGGLLFPVAEMQVSGWPAEALSNVDGLLVAIPVALMGGTPIATARDVSGLLESDLYVERRFPAAWATVSDRGLGHAALIGGSISNDVWVDRNPDNARWISSLVSILARRSAEQRQWVSPPPGPPPPEGRRREEARDRVIDVVGQAHYDLLDGQTQEYLANAVLVGGLLSPESDFSGAAVGLGKALELELGLLFGGFVAELEDSQDTAGPGSVDKEIDRLVRAVTGEGPTLGNWGHFVKAPGLDDPLQARLQEYLRRAGAGSLLASGVGRRLAKVAFRRNRAAHPEPLPKKSFDAYVEEVLTGRPGREPLIKIVTAYKVPRA